MRSLLIVITLLGSAAVARAAGTGPVEVPPPVTGKPVVTATLRFNEGEAFTRQKLWPFAESAYDEATKLQADFPEAWNGLGHARKMQRKFPEALAAYEEALRQRPAFPQALEYLGETYVAMGRMDDARATLAKLQPLDPTLGATLAKAIEEPKAAAAW